MPKLNDRKRETGIPTYLNLPQSCRDDLESAIGTPGIKTLTDAVVEAAKLLAKEIKKSRPTKPN